MVQKTMTVVSKSMSHCEELPRCAARKLACQRPNAWVIFMMAHSKVRQSLGNAQILDKNASFRAKARKYKSLVRVDAVLCLDRDGNEVRRSDNLALCAVYRQMKGINFAASVPVPVPVAQPPMTDLVLPPGDDETQAFATSVVTGTLTRFNKVYGFTGGQVRRPHGDLPIRDVKSVHDRTWLTDEIINRFMSLLWPLCPATQTIIINTQVTAKHAQGSRLSQQGQRVITAARAACNMSAPQRVKFTLFPYNHNNNHWFLIMYDHTLHKWFSYDSSDGYHGDLINAEFHTHLMTTEPASSDPGNTKVFSYDKMPTPKQPDFFQCGIWMCLLTLCVVTRQVPPKLAFDRPSSYGRRGRMYIAKTMFTNNLSLVRDPGIDLQTVMV